MLADHLGPGPGPRAAGAAPRPTRGRSRWVHPRPRGTRRAGVGAGTLRSGRAAAGRPLIARDQPKRSREK